MLKLNGRRQVSGVLRGFDQFMNLVLDDATDITPTPTTPSTSADGAAAQGQRVALGQVVIRGNSVLMIESLDKL